MMAEGNQEGRVLDLRDIAEVSFDWAAPVTVNEYVLITKSGNAAVLTPQNILFTQRLHVTQFGMGFYRVRFGMELDNGNTVDFSRVQQMSKSRTFTRQAGSDAALLSGLSIEVMLKTGDIIREDIIVSYYGSESLKYPSPLGSTALPTREWLKIQYVGALE
ncbi:MAG: hypothetical protein LBS19_09110 [Clostridiales bacterium]|jgi:hypothetical protein|nr:hypothetical protein [Clostridiales bacterium]